jgi:hypothetical protein
MTGGLPAGRWTGTPVLGVTGGTISQVPGFVNDPLLILNRLVDLPGSNRAPMIELRLYFKKSNRSRRTT